MLKQLKRKLLPYVMLYLGFPLMRLLIKTCHLKIEGASEFFDRAKLGPVILSIWHNRMAPIAFILEKNKTFAEQFQYACLVSQSRDGELLAKIIESYDQGKTIRIPGKSKHRAFKEFISACKKPKTILMITPDGPRGPRYHVKPGVVVAAKEANIPIIPLSWSATDYWELKSWDRFRIPKPFQTITAKFAPPLNIGEEPVEKGCLQLEEAMAACMNEPLRV